jgi:peptide/nickel transport system substrate-binding protein
VIRNWLVVSAALAASLVLAACGGSGSSAKPSGLSGVGVGHVIATTGTPVQGGTAYWAQQPLSPPNYIFPLVSGAYYSNENVYDFQTLMYRPLYWYGDRGTSEVDYALSLADPPVYSEDNRVVTITLKHASWSDGEPVIARDVILWLNLLRANKADWAAYVPGGFPDNVTAWHPEGIHRVVLELNRSYNPTWFTDNELSQITPLPVAWDRTNLAGCGTSACPVAATPAATPRPDQTPAGARAVYRFLNGQAKKVSGYAQSPIWSIVDGPWKLQSLTSSGQATFVPNTNYDGPDRPKLAKFVELPFTSETAEFSVLRAGTAKGDGGGSSPQISVGYVPDTDVPQAPALKTQGYRLSAFYPFGFDYFEPNFNNPTVGPILRQLYFRQAFQHLVDQRGWIHAYYEGLGAPTYSPVPAQPANPYADAQAQTNPYPFSVATAKRILAAHGWKVTPDGTTSCAHAGAGAGDCGAGIAVGKQLRFTLMYPSGMSSTDLAMVNLQSVAREVGIAITLKQVTTATIDAEIEPCKPHSAACDWQLGQYGAAWVFAPGHYPTGEEIFQSGALGNVGSYSDAAIDRLIKATTTSPADAAKRALDAYADAVRTQLPDFWQPSPGTLVTFQSNLAGTTPNAYGYLNPEEWYFIR